MENTNNTIVIENTMKQLGVLPPQIPLSQNTLPLQNTRSLAPQIPAFQTTQLPTNPTTNSTRMQQKQLNSQTYQSLVGASQNLVGPSQNLVGASQGLVGSSGQQASTVSPTSLTRSQQNPTGNQQAHCSSQQPNCLSELGKQAKQDLEILVATGKTKDFLGKIITYNDLEVMSEKEILKFFRIYQSALAVRVNDTFGKIALKSYAKLASWVLPIDDVEDLYIDLRNDYILMNEIDRWTGWLSLRMGGLMALASSGLITAGHLSSSQPEAITSSQPPILQEINESDESGINGSN